MAVTDKTTENGWTDETVKARNPDLMTPEELLGFDFAAPEPDKQEEESEKAETSFGNSTSKSLYERMMDKKRESDKAAEEMFDVPEETEEADGNESFHSKTVAGVAAVFAAESSDSGNDEITLTLDAFDDNEDNDTDTDYTDEDDGDVTVISFDKPEDDIEIITAETEEVGKPEPVSVTVEDQADEDDGAVVIRVKDADPDSVDAFKDFFNSLEADTKSAAADVPTKADDDFDRLLGSVSPAAPQEETEADALASAYAVLNGIRASTAAEKQAAIQTTDTKVADEAEDVKVFEPSEDTEVGKVNDTASDDAVDLDATIVIDKVDTADSSDPKDDDHSSPVPPYSLYSSGYVIDPGAVEKFFNGENTGDTIEQINVPDEAKEIKHSERVHVEENDDGSPFAVFSDDISDYTDLNSAAGIKDCLLTRRKRLTVRLVLTSVLSLLMLFLNGWFFAMRNIDAGTVPNIINLVLTAAVAVINYRSFIGIFKGDCDVDMCAASTSFVILLESLITVIFFGGVGGGLGIISGVSFIICLIGKLAVCSATLKGLCLIATNENKYAVTLTADPQSATEMASGSVEGDACVAYGKSTVNVGGFLKNWYRRTSADRSAPRFVIIAAVIGIIAAVASAIVLNFDSGYIFATFAVVFSLCAAPTVHFICSLPASRMVNSLKGYGATVFGLNGAKAISDCNAAVISGAELFPKGTVVLRNMMPLSANSVDKSIAYAAALAKEANSPLAPIFEDIIKEQDGEKMTVDHIKYENKLGISGWVNDIPVFIGSRTLMENHNIKTPSQEFDRKITAAGYKAVYLACKDIPCLLFVVQYNADPDIQYELGRLCDTGASVVVVPNDPNLTEKFLCDCFDLQDDDLCIISAKGALELEKNSRFEQSTNGFAMYKNGGAGLIASVSSSIRVFSATAILKVLHIIGIVAGIAAFGLIAFNAKAFPPASALIAAGLEAVFACVSAIVSFLKRP